MSVIKEDYYKIIESYVEGKLSADEFKKIYTDKYLDEQREYGDDLFDILDRIFAEADLYTKDAYLLEKFDFYLTEDQLFQGAKQALQDLRDVE